MNPYGYVLNSPIIYFDPLGLGCKDSRLDDCEVTVFANPYGVLGSGSAGGGGGANNIAQAAETGAGGADVPVGMDIWHNSPQAHSVITLGSKSIAP